MKKNKRRNTSALAPLTPDFSQPAPVTAPAPNIAECYRQLAALRTRLVERDQTIRNERKRHAGIEAVTLRLVTQLEQQVSDLRSAIFQNLAMRPGQK